jgi:metal-sulfur cluster biosynthetic enzyme
MIDKEEIISTLTKDYGPKIPIDTVDMGLIRGIKIDTGNVQIQIKLMVLGCPISNFIAENIKQKEARVIFSKGHI